MIFPLCVKFSMVKQFLLHWFLIRVFVSINRASVVSYAAPLHPQSFHILYACCRIVSKWLPTAILLKGISLVTCFRQNISMDWPLPEPFHPAVVSDFSYRFTHLNSLCTSQRSIAPTSIQLCTELWDTAHKKTWDVCRVIITYLNLTLGSKLHIVELTTICGPRNGWIHFFLRIGKVAKDENFLKRLMVLWNI